MRCGSVQTSLDDRDKLGGMGPPPKGPATRRRPIIACGLAIVLVAILLGIGWRSRRPRTGSVRTGRESAGPRPSTAAVPRAREPAGRPPSLPKFVAQTSPAESKLESDLRTLREQIAARPPARSKEGQLSRLALPEFVRCYRELAAANPEAVEAGSATVRVVFTRHGLAGRVQSATILARPPKADTADLAPDDSRRELRSPLALQCVLTALQRTAFPPPDQENETVDLSFGTGGPPR